MSEIDLSLSLSVRHSQSSDVANPKIVSSGSPMEHLDFNGQSGPNSSHRREPHKMKWDIITNAVNGKRYVFLPRSIDTFIGIIPAGTFCEVLSEIPDHYGHTLLRLQTIGRQIIDGVDITSNPKDAIGVPT